MTPTSVGMRCPECAGETTKVRSVPRRTASNPYGTMPFSLSDPSTWTVTGALIVINVLVFVAEIVSGMTLSGSGNSEVVAHGILFGPALTGHNPYALVIPGTHEYYRLLTSGFLHESIIHIGMNMVSLFFIGRMLEPAIGKGYFALIYFTSLLCGSLGALVFTPNQPTLGASGAIFGIFGALIVVAHARRIPLWQSGLLPILMINLIYSLTVTGVSLGGHVGGLAGGLATGWLVVEFGERRSRGSVVVAGSVLIAVAAVVVSVMVATSAASSLAL